MDYQPETFFSSILTNYESEKQQFSNVTIEINLLQFFQNIAFTAAKYDVNDWFPQTGDNS